MPRPLRTVLIVYREGNTDAEAVALEAGAWLAARGVSALCAVFGDAFCRLVRALREAPDLVVAVGGDGTMLSACRTAAGTGTPVFGLNRGNLGFLAGADAAAWSQAMECLARGDYGVSERLLLECAVMRGGERLAIAPGAEEGDVALNEVCLARGSLARIMEFEMFVDGQRLGSLRADGVIFSTPTGATGYSVSAGGPMLLPEMDAYAITPICPFLLSFPPLVVFGASTVRAVVRDPGGGAIATLDGHNSMPLMEGDEALVRKAPFTVRIANLPGYSYFEALRTKGFLRS